MFGPTTVIPLYTIGETVSLTEDAPINACFVDLLTSHTRAAPSFRKPTTIFTELFFG
jgi:hypothetical protein